MQVRDSLRWFSRGASVGGANVKLCIWAVWGSSGRPPVSVGILGRAVRDGSAGGEPGAWAGVEMAAGSEVGRACPLGSGQSAAGVQKAKARCRRVLVVRTLVLVPRRLLALVVARRGRRRVDFL